MAKTLHEEILSGLFEKQASAEDTKNTLGDLSTEELRKLAADLSALTGDEDLARMAQVMPVYGSGGDLGKKIEDVVEINTADPDVTPTPAEVEAAKEDISVVASAEDEDAEKIAAEDEDKEDKKDDEKKEDEDKEEDKKEDEKKEDCKEEKSATEQLLSILKEAAEAEELDSYLDRIASERAVMMIKEAEDMEVARAIADHAANALTDNPMKAHEYSQQIMDRSRTVAATQDVPVPQAAQAVAATVVSQAATPEKQASYFLGLLSKEAEALEATYEKLAAEAGDIAEQVIIAEGQKMGLNDMKLHEYVQRAMEDVKTVAAKKDVNLAQAAQMYIAGDRGSVAGVNEGVGPSPSQAPSPVKAPINSNQTQDPDMYVAQMANDPNLAKAAAPSTIDLGVLKQAMEYVAFCKEAINDTLTPQQ